VLASAMRSAMRLSVGPSESFSGHLTRQTRLRRSAFNSRAAGRNGRRRTRNFLGDSKCLGAKWRYARALS
jgi:hypothetical protein